MPKIIIPSFADDEHALIIAAALDIKGVDCDIWYTTDYPSIQSQSFTISSEKACGFEISAENHTVRLNDYGTIWWRRHSPPNFGPLIVPVEDEDFITRQGIAHHTTVMKFVSHYCRGSKIFIANDPVAANTSNSKFLQLTEARSLGFALPDTLASNDASRVKAFIRSNAANGKATIRKSYVPAVWIENGASIANYTSLIKESDLDYFEDTIPYADIYQAQIDRVAEIRVFIFGKTLFAVKISPRNDNFPHADWRRIADATGVYSEYELPGAVSEKCFRIIESLGLVTASIDLCLDNDGAFVFLELNESGQFLWLCDRLPDIPLIDAFSEFLCSQDKDYVWPRRRAELDLSSVESSDEYKRRKSECQVHLGASILDVRYPKEERSTT
ncbi:MAG TPA: hypothetical protein VED40_23130 [Azospirillaceae bacterium]|nr:hypothetical protein [Azospirillaceae bacterium]